MQLFNKTKNSMKTQSKTFYPHQFHVVGNLLSKVYRIINAPKLLSIFSRNTPKKSMKYKYNTLVHRKENDIRNER